MQKCWPLEATVTMLSEDILYVENLNLQGSSVLEQGVPLYSSPAIQS